MVLLPKRLHHNLEIMEEKVLKETILKGSVTLVVWKNGVPIESYTEDNLIVNVGKQSMARLLGAADTDKRVTKIGFGTSGAVTAGANTSIENEFVKALNGVTYSGTSAIFEYALETTENNGVTIREFALFSDDDTMFSRIVRNPINKTADIRLSGTWKITF